MDESLCVCGLANTLETTKRIHGHRRVGPQVAPKIDAFLDDNHGLEQQIFAAIGDEKADSDALSAQLDHLREQVAAFLTGEMAGEQPLR